MLKIDLSKIIDQINAHRNKVRYPFQELALMLTEKLNDPSSKNLYMKLAKNEEQELIMRALSYTLASLDGPTNKGRFFMWKLSELKHAEIEPLSLFLMPADFEYDGMKPIKLGTIDIKERGNYPYAKSAVELIKEKYGDPIELSLSKSETQENSYTIEQNMSFRLKNSLKSFFKDFNQEFDIKLYPAIFLPASFFESLSETNTSPEKIKISFHLSVSFPILTNKTRQYKIRES